MNETTGVSETENMSKEKDMTQDMGSRKIIEDNIFPRWALGFAASLVEEHIIPTLGTKHSHTGNKMGLRLAFDEITARASRHYVSCPTTLRLVISLLLMMLIGVGETWGQRDYSGTYYIASSDSRGGNKITDIHYNSATPTENYYLCPTDEENWICYVDPDSYTDSDNDQPFLTTYKYRAPEKDATNAVWIVEKAPNSEYYYIIHKKTTRYLTYNGPISERGNNKSGKNRIRFHLQSTATNNSLFNFIQDDDVSAAVNIVSIGAIENDYEYNGNKPKYLNLSSKDDNSLVGTNGKTDGPEDCKNVGATIGIWHETGRSSEWFLEIPSPSFTKDLDSNIEISEIENADIYYTTNGTDPVVPSAGQNPTGSTSKYSAAIPLVNNQIMIKAIATNTGHFVNSPIITYVYTQDITWTESSFVYNGTAQEPTVTSVKVGENDVPEAEYQISCTDNINAGTATLTLTDKVAGNNYIVSGSTTFEIAPLVATLEWSGTDLQYSGSAQQPTATVSNLVGEDVCTVTVTGEQTNMGSYTATATALSNSNYALPATVTQSFTISPKSLGSGIIPAADITIDPITKSGNTYSDPGINHNGTPLTIGTSGTDYDYSCTIDDSNTKYHVVTFTGANNYTGAVTAKFANITFGTKDNTEYSATFINDNELDGDFASPAGITPYIITGIIDNTVTAVALDYIPYNVPVLLMTTDAATYGFNVYARGDGEDADASGNLLSRAEKVENEETHEMEDPYFEPATIYILYNGEFVLNAAGTLPAGKVYLSKSAFAGSRTFYARLFINWGETTGIENAQISDTNPKLSGTWYTLDGRRLTNKPVEKGLYLRKGEKIVIR